MSSPPTKAVGLDHPDSRRNKKIPKPSPVRRSEAKRREAYKHKYPGGMNHYERSRAYQLVMLILLTGISIANLKFNFLLIDVIEEGISLLGTLPEAEDALINASGVLEEFNATEEKNNLCAADFFAEEFEKNDLDDSLVTILRVVKASAYFTAFFGFWFTLLVKGLTAYNLATEDFNVMPPEQIMAERKSSVMDQIPQLANFSEDKEKQQPSSGRSDGPPAPKPVATPEDLNAVIRTAAAGEKVQQETEGEKKIRTYLRAETVLFGFNQVTQDIPILTSAIIFLLFLLRERGILCYESYSNGELATVFSVDEADPAILGQLAIIMVNIFANVILNLAPRWVAYFHYETVRNSKNPQSTAVRIFQICGWLLAYFFGVLAPLFAILYSRVGSDLLGLETSGSLSMMVLLIFSAVALVLGSLIICCFWGNTFGEQICVCFVLFEALEIGCEETCEIEICELSPCNCCC